MAKLRAATAPLPMAIMQIAPEQAAFLAFLVRLIGAKNALEVGTFTGYSALAVALALPKGGRLVACDISEEWTSIGRPYWKEAGVARKIDLRLGPAIETLKTLIREGRAGTFDFAFIDAAKSEYDAYFEGTLKLVRKGGLIVLDNMLQDGRVADPKATRRRRAGDQGAQRQDRRRSARRCRPPPARRRRHGRAEEIKNARGTSLRRPDLRASQGKW